MLTERYVPIQLFFLGVLLSSLSQKDKKVFAHSQLIAATYFPTSITRFKRVEIKQTMTIVHKLVSEESVLRSRTTKPPPSTVSIVLARIFGVNASKS